MRTCACALHTHVVPEVDLAPGVRDLLHLLGRERREALRERDLLDVLRAAARGDGDGAGRARPEQQHVRVVDGLARFFGQALRDAREDRAERAAAARVPHGGRERAVRLRHDPVLRVDLEDRLEVREKVRVVLDLRRWP
jgi:hypothetical protein